MGKTKQPKAEARELSEIIHGFEVHDDYRWLEDMEDGKVQEWIEGQNLYTKSRMNRIRGRPIFRERLEKLLDTDFVGAPSVKGDKLFYYKKPKGVQQQYLVTRAWPDGEEQIILDPNEMADDGSLAIAGISTTKDATLMAYGITKDGSDWSHWRILNLETGEHLEDEIPRISGPGIAWLPDKSGFYYRRSPVNEDGELERTGSKVYFHELGTDWKLDEMVFGEDLSLQHGASASVTEEGNHVLYWVFKGWGKNELYISDLDGTNTRHVTKHTGPIDFNGVTVRGDKIYMLTNHEAPRFQLSVAPIDDPDAENWETIIPEGKGVIENFEILGKRLFVQDKVNVADRVRQYTLKGTFKREIELPTLGTTGGPWGNAENGAMFMSFSSFTYPGVTYKFDPEKGELEEFITRTVPFDPSDYEVEQKWFTSKDGTEVPMFILRRADLELDGNNPTILYGYGGFNISLQPEFAASRIAWLEQGGIYAIANLRGGAEFGQEWHEAGMFEKKQNVFDDFIAAAEHLIWEGYTSPENLAVQGGSNGGLLTAAVAVQRPDLYKVVWSAVPLTDMVRLHLFGENSVYWAEHEYGIATNPDQLEYLLEYSPYHNVSHGHYPITVLKTAEGDDRGVHPSHAMKMAAHLQEKAHNPEDIHLIVSKNTGHGHSKSIKMTVDELTDFYSFMARHLGLNLKENDQGK